MNRRDTLVSLLALGIAPASFAQSVLKVPQIALVDTAEQIADMAEGRHPQWARCWRS